MSRSSRAGLCHRWSARSEHLGDHPAARHGPGERQEGKKCSMHGDSSAPLLGTGVIVPSPSCRSAPTLCPSTAKRIQENRVHASVLHIPISPPPQPFSPCPSFTPWVQGRAQGLQPGAASSGTEDSDFPKPSRMQHERLFFPLQTARTRLSSSPDNEDIQQTCLLLVSLVGEPKGSRQHLCRALYSDGERNAGCPGELVMRAGRIRQKHTMGWLQQGASTRQRVPALRPASPL